MVKTIFNVFFKQTATGIQNLLMQENKVWHLFQALQNIKSRNICRKYEIYLLNSGK